MGRGGAANSRGALCVDGNALGFFYTNGRFQVCDRKGQSSAKLDVKAFGNRDLDEGADNTAVDLSVHEIDEACRRPRHTTRRVTIARRRVLARQLCKTI
jgi:hypothetical protein